MNLKELADLTADKLVKSLFCLAVMVGALVLLLLWVVTMALSCLSQMLVKLLMRGVARILGPYNTGKN